MILGTPNGARRGWQSALWLAGLLWGLAGCAPANLPPPLPPQPMPTAAPLNIQALIEQGDLVEVIPCGGDPAWTLPSREEQQAAVWERLLRGADAHERAQALSAFNDSVVLSTQEPLLSQQDELLFEERMARLGLWNASANGWHCRQQPPDEAPYAVELLLKGYRVTQVRRAANNLLIVAAPAPGFEWVRLELAPEWGPLYSYVRLEGQPNELGYNLMQYLSP